VLEGEGTRPQSIVRHPGTHGVAPIQRVCGVSRRVTRVKLWITAIQADGWECGGGGFRHGCDGVDRDYRIWLVGRYLLLRSIAESGTAENRTPATHSL
jgi:hypothetical protein